MQHNVNRRWLSPHSAPWRHWCRATMAATALNTCTDMGSYGCRREALRCHLLGEATAIGNEQPHPLCSKNSDGDSDHPFTKIQVKFLFAPPCSFARNLTVMRLFLFTFSLSDQNIALWSIICIIWPFICFTSLRSTSNLGQGYVHNQMTSCLFF